MKLTRELFIFSCETGLRFSDVLDLKWTHLKNIKGVTYISKIQCKTKELVEIPVTLKWPKVLLAKYRNVSTGEHVFPSLSNNCVNRKLKMLAEKAGIGKRLVPRWSAYLRFPLGERGHPALYGSETFGR